MEQLSWYIWLAPMLIVPIILLFAFLGCSRTGLREPEFERIAFDGHRGPSDRRGSIYVIRTDVSAPITDVTLAPTDNHGPSWSPTGQQLAFGGFDPIGGVRAGVWVLNVGLDGRPAGSPVLVANSRTSSLINNVAWGPGGLIAYEDENAIWTIPATATPGTASPTRRTPPGILAHHPTWAPDGSIAFTNTLSGNTFIFIIDAAGSLRQLVAGSSGDEHEPSWNPNGSGIIFVRGNDLVYFDLASNSENLIINDGRNPVFGPNSANIAFVRSGMIWTCAANGSNPQPLTPGPSDNRPSWTHVRL
jgi:Tol biopolymer transport system component